MTKENKIAIATKLASAFEPIIGKNFTDLPRNMQFGIIINKQFKAKGKIASLSARYAEDTAMHITNLILRKLNNSYDAETIVEID